MIKRVLYKKSIRMSAPKYTGHIQLQSKGTSKKEEGQQKTISPFNEDQVGSFSIYNLVQENKLQKKNLFNLWLESFSFSNDLLFLSFQIPKNAQRNHFPPFFLFIQRSHTILKGTLQQRKITPKTFQKENNSCHEALILPQYRIVNQFLLDVTKETSIKQCSTSFLKLM